MLAFESFIPSDTPSLAPDATLRRDATISSAELLANRKLIHIQHRGELYQLRETRLGKLILTK